MNFTILHRMLQYDDHYAISKEIEILKGMYENTYLGKLRTRKRALKWLKENKK